MGISNKCYACDHYDGDDSPPQIRCSKENRLMNGTIGCSSFKPDSLAGCLKCEYFSFKNKEFRSGFICQQGVSSVEVDGYCKGFTRANYWTQDEMK